MAMFTVASYNIRKAIGTDRLRRPERILRVINELGADIIALQEADRRLGARPTALPLALIAEHTDFVPIVFETPTIGIGWHGNAMLVRKHIKVISHQPITLPMLEPRGAVSVELALHGQRLRVIGMHLALSATWRRRQARAILATLGGAHSLPPAILMGDLNEWSLHGGCLHDFAEQCRMAHTGPSFHARRPMARLDRIMVSDGLRIIAAGTHRSALARMASDHLPVWAKLAF